MRRRGRGVRFSLRLMLAMGGIALVSVLALSFQFMRIGQRTLADQTAASALTIIEKSERLLNQRLNALMEQSLQLLVDQTLYEQMERIELGGVAGFYAVSTEIKEMLSRRFSINECILAVDIVHPQYAFAYHRAGAVDYADFMRRDAFSVIQRQMGGAVWGAPGDSGFYTPGVADAQDFQGAFWFARALNMTSIQHFSQVYDREQLKPVLLFVLRAETFSAPMLEGIDIEGARYFMAERGGKLLFGGKDGEQEALSQAILALGDASSAVARGKLAGEETIFCLTTSEKTGWIHVVAFPRDAVTGAMIHDLAENTLRSAVILLLLMTAVALALTKAVSQTVNRLIDAVKRVEAGDFDHRVESRSNDDFSYLIDRFNEMNRSIKRLIEENLQVKLREKDTQIMALTVQFNPHYLYNTLNIIHWAAMRGEAKTAGRMIHSLSRMLRYTSDQKQERTRLKDDLDWMKQYLYLMRSRFDELFTVNWRIEQGLNEALVPKLFLQPLIENAILHGFKDMEEGGLIEIEGARRGDELVFAVCDNGGGIPPETLLTILDDERCGRIGLQNVHRRIRLMYGEAYGLSIESAPGRGTRVTVRLPLCDET